MALGWSGPLVTPPLLHPTPFSLLVPPRRPVAHLFSLSTSTVSIGLKLRFSKSFYFELILDSLKKIRKKINKEFPCAHHPVSLNISVLPNMRWSSREITLVPYHSPELSTLCSFHQLGPCTSFVLKSRLHLVLVSPPVTGPQSFFLRDNLDLWHVLVSAFRMSLQVTCLGTLIREGRNMPSRDDAVWLVKEVMVLVCLITNEAGLEHLKAVSQRDFSTVKSLSLLCAYYMSWGSLWGSAKAHSGDHRILDFHLFLCPMISIPLYLLLWPILQRNGIHLSWEIWS